MEAAAQSETSSAHSPMVKGNIVWKLRRGGERKKKKPHKNRGQKKNTQQKTHCSKLVDGLAAAIHNLGERRSVFVESLQHKKKKKKGDTNINKKKYYLNRAL